MTETTSNTPTQSEHHDLPTPISQDAAIPYWRTLAVVRWLQQQLSQILSQLHLLAITRGRSLPLAAVMPAIHPGRCSAAAGGGCNAVAFRGCSAFIPGSTPTSTRGKCACLASG